MKKFIDTIKESVAKHTAEWITSLLLSLLVILGLALKSVFVAHIWPVLSKELLGRILAGTILLLLAAMAWAFYVRRKLREATTFFSLFGALWNNDLAPHCPACKISLGRYGVDVGEGPGCQCAGCKEVIRFGDESGRTMSLKGAIEAIRTRRPTKA